MEKRRICILRLGPKQEKKHRDGFILSLFAILAAVLATASWAGNSKGIQGNSPSKSSNALGEASKGGGKKLKKKHFQYIIDGRLEKFQAALDSSENYDLDSSHQDGLTPLMLASCVRQPKIIQYLLEKGADPNIRTEKEIPEIKYKAFNTWSYHCYKWNSGWTVLDYVLTYYGIGEEALLLLGSENLDPSNLNETWLSQVFEYMVKENNSKILQRIIQNYKKDDRYLNLNEIYTQTKYNLDQAFLLPIINAQSQAQLNLLMAARSNECLKILLDEGADPHHRVSIEGPLHGISTFEYYYRLKYWDRLQFILESGKLNLSALPSEDVSDFFVELAKAGNLKAVQWWVQNVKNKFNINGRDKATGSTALYWAVKNGVHLPVIRLLLENGANPDEPSMTDQKTAADLIASAPEGELKNLYIHYKNGNLFRNPDFLRTMSDKDLVEMFFKLSTFGKVEYMEQVILVMKSRVLDINQRDSNHQTALMNAVRTNQPSIVRVLLNQGATSYANDGFKTEMNAAWRFRFFGVVEEFSRFLNR